MMVLRFFPSLVALFVLLGLNAGLATATDESVIVRHRNQAGLPFSSTAGPNPESALLFHRQKQGTPTETAPELQECTDNRVRRTSSIHSTPGATSMDLVFFDPEFDLDRRRANQLTGSTKIPYRPSNSPNRQPTTEESLSYLVAPLGIRCLPTRFRIVDIRGARFLEYREGLSAWNTDEQ